jgi:hypothetical protein
MILRAALGMLFCLLFALPCRADNQPAMAVPGVSVDVTASDAVSAREKALLEGQRQALSTLLNQLATPADIAKLPPLSDAQITDMVADYQVESEKVSSVRYIGQITFRFRADAVSNYLGQGGISATVGTGPPVLVLPVLTSGGKNLLFEDGNSWLAAWNQHRPADGVVRLVLPLGDAADVAAITGDEALAGDSAKLQALATRYGVGEVVVADATVDPGNLALAVKRYTPAGAVGGFEDKFAGEPDAAFVAAIDRVATQTQQDWIAQNRVTSSVEQRLTVEAPLGSLAQWSEMNRRFAAVATLRHVDVVYLMRGRAELDLVFVGDRGQLAQALGQQGMVLQDTADGQTTLSLAGGTQP